MKRGIVVLMILFGISLSAYGNTFHRYISGTVDAVSDHSIVVSGQSYTLAWNVIYRVYDRNRNGSYSENIAHKSDVRVGQSVTIKAEASTVQEVIVARWKE